ncbi:helix-turn-helix domain-containing protein [Streptomyces sp. AMCC400023]|uniref:helix-turn-helix domain-containing protein n=1 Tax=Streptomyces sp. AMCC400023 TaxID=2056258 RepID=UPI001F311E56|nr:helix-turn-helix transcriptional regulator [Streptomyces sp. AMCC400023]
MCRLNVDLIRQRAAEMGDRNNQQIADRAGLSRSVVSRTLAGSLPEVTNLVRLARAYGIRLDDVLVMEEQDTEPVKATA